MPYYGREVCISREPTDRYEIRKLVGWLVIEVEYLYSAYFFFFFFLNLSYRGAAIPLPVVRDHLNGNLPTTVPAPEV